MTGLVLETTSGMKTGPAFPGLLGSRQEQVWTLEQALLPVPTRAAHWESSRDTW